MTPQVAAWLHRGASTGFEVLFASQGRFEGHVTAAEQGEAWAVRYVIEAGADWVTRRAQVTCRSAAGERSVELEPDGRGVWRVDGEPAPQLDGCLDVDLDASAFTNAFPVNRLKLEVGESADAPAAYVRAPDLAVERLDQRYARVDDRDGRSRYDYAAPRFGFTSLLAYDTDGLVADYPGIALRVR